MSDNNVFYPAENWQESQCAFCLDPIDYCQGHGDIEYAVRTIKDGELTRPIEFYSDIEKAYANFEALSWSLTPGESAMIYDQAGDVEAEVSAS